MSEVITPVTVRQVSVDLVRPLRHRVLRSGSMDRSSGSCIGHGADGLIEAHPHWGVVRDGHPVLSHLRNRGTQRQVLALLSTKCPPEPSRATDIDVDRHLLAGAEALQRRQASGAYRQRQALPPWSECLYVLDRPSQRLHRDARQRGGVAGERHA